MSRYTRTTYSGIGYPQWTRAVRLLILACVVTYVLQFILDAVIGRGGFTYTFGLVPWDVTRHFYLWQPFTYIFLHDTGSILHILFNMLGLWMFGSDLELLWGTRLFTRFFFICGVGAGILMVLLSPSNTNVTIGASGSIYGILLAFGMLFPDRIIYWVIFPIPAKYFVMIMGGIAFFSSLSASGGRVAHVAHLGGMLCGYLYLKSGAMRRTNSRGSILGSIRARYAEWRRQRLRRKFEVYYNQKHREEDEKWRRWKN